MRSLSQSASFVWSIGLFGCLSAVAVDSSFPAIPALMQDFQIDLQAGQRMVSLYLLGFALGQVPFGALSDRYGRLPMIYVGLFGFLLATLGGLMADNIFQLGVARFFQGFAGASGSVMSRSIARDVATGRELARLNAFVVVCMGVAMVTAPVLGSLLTHWLGWRGSFLPSLVLVVLVVILVKRFVPETKTPSEQGVSILSQTLSNGRIFFSSRQFLWGAAVLGATFFSFMALLAGLGQTLVDHYKLPNVFIGPFFSLAALFYVGAGSFGRHLLIRHDPLTMIRFGGVAYGCAVVVALMVLFVFPGNVFVFWLGLATFMVGMGFVIPSAMAVTLAPFSTGVGLAASMLGTTQISLSAAGSFLVGLSYQEGPLGLFQVMAIGLLAVVILIALSKRLLADSFGA